MRIGDIVEGKLKAPEYACVYIISDEKEEVIYIGKSFRMEHRIFDHYSPVPNITTGAFAEFAKANLPASLEWTIDFVSHPADMKYPEKWARDKEYELIQLYWPQYNIQGVSEEQGEYA